MSKTRQKIESSIVVKHDLLDGDASIYRHKRSGDVWQFRFYIKDENRHYRKSLKTKDYNLAIGKAKELALELITNVRTGKQIFNFFILFTYFFAFNWHYLTNFLNFYQKNKLFSL